MRSLSRLQRRRNAGMRISQSFKKLLSRLERFSCSTLTVLVLLENPSCEICTPNERKMCTCDSGGVSFSLCKASGQGWSNCHCSKYGTGESTCDHSAFDSRVACVRVGEFCDFGSDPCPLCPQNSCAGCSCSDDGWWSCWLCEPGRDIN